MQRSLIDILPHCCRISTAFLHVFLFLKHSLPPPRTHPSTCITALIALVRDPSAARPRRSEFVQLPLVSCFESFRYTSYTRIHHLHQAGSTSTLEGFGTPPSLREQPVHSSIHNQHSFLADVPSLSISAVFPTIRLRPIISDEL